MLEKMCKQISRANTEMTGRRLLMGRVIQEVNVVFIIVDKPDELRVAANHAVSPTLNNATGRTHCSFALRAW